jgi:BlaI family transcriptional regulator, penicillinase repressor
MIIAAKHTCGMCAFGVTPCHMTIRNSSRAPLTELQQAILDFIWENGPVTSEEVREALQPKHPLKDPSVRTLLRRLEQRGYIHHRPEGKVFKYRAKVHSRSVAARVVQNMIQRFCSGSSEQFLLGLVDENVLSADEIQRLAKKIRKQR